MVKNIKVTFLILLNKEKVNKFFLMVIAIKGITFKESLMGMEFINFIAANLYMKEILAMV
jgi:hypothetical protein